MCLECIEFFKAFRFHSSIFHCHSCLNSKPYLFHKRARTCMHTHTHTRVFPFHSISGPIFVDSVPEIQTSLALQLSEIELRISIGILVKLKNSYADIAYHVLHSDYNEFSKKIPTVTCPTYSYPSHSIRYAGWSSSFRSSKNRVFKIE